MIGLERAALVAAGVSGLVAVVAALCLVVDPLWVLLVAALLVAALGYVFL